jgi:lysosomal-associated membrane protein 1/2
MVFKIPSIFLLFASMFLISSAYKLSPPNNYSWPQNSTNLCFAARFVLTLNVQYLQATGAHATANIPLNIDTFETYRVSCTTLNNTHELLISMMDGLTNIFIQFSVNGSNTTSLSKIYGYVSINDKYSYFKDYSANVEGVHKFSSNESLFQTERGHSYRCNTKTSIQGFNTDGNVTVTSVDLENLRIQPFVDDSKKFDDFGDETVCSADVAKDSNLIPIIVGACLAVLVVIVLIAYLIGRRRSRNGYQSV